MVDTLRIHPPLQLSMILKRRLCTIHIETCRGIHAFGCLHVVAGMLAMRRYSNHAVRQGQSTLRKKGSMN